MNACTRIMLYDLYKLFLHFDYVANKNVLWGEEYRGTIAGLQIHICIYMKWLGNSFFFKAEIS